jgi:hypothetical protein
LRGPFFAFESIQVGHERVHLISREVDSTENVLGGFGHILKKISGAGLVGIALDNILAVMNIILVVVNIILVVVNIILVVVDEVIHLLDQTLLI